MNPLAQTLEAEFTKRSELLPVSKLLLNAWTAEYALRIKPLHCDREYLNQALNWFFPQAYYAVLFSVRAVLAVDDIRMTSQDEIEKLMNQWAKAGADGPVYTQQGNPFEGLTQYRIKADSKPRLMSGPEAAALHINLIKKVDQVNTTLETYIHNRLGTYLYAMLISNAPDYLRRDYLQLRAQLVLNPS